MNEFIRILRDPNPEPPAGGPPANPPAPVAVIPKTKEEWDSLRTSDPGRWIDLTQPRMDQAIRETREAKEQKAAADLKAKNLEAELANLKKTPVTPVTPGTPPVPDAEVPFSPTNMPQTKDQWDELWLTDPNLAADLRVLKNEQERNLTDRQVKQQQEFATARRESAKDLWDRHPDMYVLERDENGQVKTDGNGKPILKIDPNLGGPMLDLESEKGKLFVEVWNGDPGFEAAKTGPRLAMLEMERRLQDKGKAKIEAGQPPGQNAGTPPDQRGAMPGGVPPPVLPKVSFRSEEERAHVEKAIQRGVWKSPEEYCAMRDGKNPGFVETGRTPSFNK